jgi:peptide/nickel transport system permease protein
MTGFLLRRLAASLLLLWLVLTLTFFLLRSAPGDPAELLLDPRSSPETREQLRHALGIDRPVGEQYLHWLASVVRFDWGISFRHQEPVTDVLLEAFPHTLLLALTALLIGYATGLPLGIAAARRRDGRVDHLIRFGSLLVYSLPLFWTGLMALLLLTYVFPLLPAGHMHSVGVEEMSPLQRWLDLLLHLILPAAVLSSTLTAGLTRFVRNSLLETFGQDYLRTARAKGLGERRVVWVHALRNAVVPVVQLFGVTFPAMLNGSLIVEVIFSWPGLGRTIYNAILFRDYPLILAATAFSGMLVVVGNLMADLLHALVDPRVRHG